MTTVAWPAFLPDWEAEPLAVDLDGGLIESGSDTGAPKVRPRFTRLRSSFRVTVLLDGQDTATQFYDWFDVNLARGANRLSRPHPITGRPGVWRMGQLNVATIGPLAWQASFVLTEV